MGKGPAMRGSAGTGCGTRRGGGAPVPPPPPRARRGVLLAATALKSSPVCNRSARAHALRGKFFSCRWLSNFPPPTPPLFFLSSFKQRGEEERGRDTGGAGPAAAGGGQSPEEEGSAAARRRLPRPAVPRVAGVPALGAAASDGLGEPQLLKPRTSPLPLPLLALQDQSPRKTHTRAQGPPSPFPGCAETSFSVGLFLLRVKWREPAPGRLRSRARPAPHRLASKQVKGSWQ